MKRESIKLLKDFILESRAEIGKGYKKKEVLRESIQEILKNEILSKEISSKEELLEWWKNFDMAANALRAVPFEVWYAISERD